MSGVRPSPLVVVPGAAPAPSTTWLERAGLAPSHVIALACILASGLAGQAIPWPALLATVTSTPPTP